MKKTEIRLTVTHMLLLASLFAATATAQQPRIYSEPELLQLGNANYGQNCVTSSKYYFAYLQRVPQSSEWKRLNQRIEDCERDLEFAGNEGKFDAPGRNERSCHAYAQLAVAQQRINRGAQCKLGGSRWSLDYAAHSAWCMSPDVKSSDWRRENDERRKALDTCVFK